MTTIWRKALVVGVVAAILALAGIQEIAAWLARHGAIQLAETAREQFLTGTAITVILAMLVLTRSQK